MKKKQLYATEVAYSYFLGKVRDWREAKAQTIICDHDNNYYMFSCNMDKETAAEVMGLIAHYDKQELLKKSEGEFVIDSTSSGYAITRES